jgi:hypothetical protein
MRGPIDGRSRFSIVNVALPAIQETFGCTQERLQWIVSAYAVTFGGLLLPGVVRPTWMDGVACSSSARCCSMCAAVQAYWLRSRDENRLCFPEAGR